MAFLVVPSPSLNVIIHEVFLAAALVNAYAAGSRKDAPFSTDAIEAILLGKLEVPKNGSKAARNAVGDPSGSVVMRLDIHIVQKRTRTGKNGGDVAIAIPTDALARLLDDYFIATLFGNREIPKNDKLAVGDPRGMADMTLKIYQNKSPACEACVQSIGL
ncbi:unnamed protein product [Closterium sp. Yama58-4]|nr:unnamed protein product [Closterium sp. Yama58-4]